MKDAYYFPHDSNAKDDPKCVLLIEQMGLEGYGIFWILVETLRDQPDYTYPLNLVPALSRRYNTTASKMRTVIDKYDLFTVTEDGKFFFSKSLNKRMIAFEKRRAAGRIAGKKSAENRLLLNDRSTTVQPMFNDCSTDVQRSLNEPSTVKESKVKESKDKESTKDVDSSPEPKIAPGCKPIILLPLVDKTEYPVFQQDIDEWALLYPAVDVLQELRGMKGWLDGSPAKRKTRRGVKRFINGWLARSQDRGGNKREPPKNSGGGDSGGYESMVFPSG